MQNEWQVEKCLCYLCGHASELLPANFCVITLCFIGLQVQLQNILMSKYVEYFQTEVSGWQRKLMVADLVISTWMSVQRTWAHLNSIFTNSHDIRCQLAYDAERFHGIHADFQVTLLTSHCIYHHDPKKNF